MLLHHYELADLTAHRSIISWTSLMSDKKKQLMFSVTAKDCEFIDKRGSGKGGQKKNKTSSAIQCRHRPSGAMGEAEDHREQSLNRRLAFKRMAESVEFQ